jgi:hypothetical protein
MRPCVRSSVPRKTKLKIKLIKDYVVQRKVSQEPGPVQIWGKSQRVDLNLVSGTEFIAPVMTEFTTLSQNRNFSWVRK